MMLSRLRRARESDCTVLPRPPCPTPAARHGLTSLPAGTTSFGAKGYGDRFVWSIYVNDHVPEVPGVPISGSAATLERATAAMLTSYGRMRAKAGLPKRTKGG
jgi:hypothetical protein